MFRSSSSSHRSHHKQLSSSLSFRRIAASPFLEEGSAGSGAITILRSPARGGRVRNMSGDVFITYLRMVVDLVP